MKNAQTDRAPEETLSRDQLRLTAKLNLLLWVPTVVALVVGGLIFIWQAQARAHDNDARILASCQNRNSTQELYRRDLREILRGVDAETGASDAVARIESRLSTALDADSDCDGDGWLTVNDYDIPKPDNLPIAKKESTS